GRVACAGWAGGWGCLRAERRFLPRKSLHRVVRATPQDTPSAEGRARMQVTGSGEVMHPEQGGEFVGGALDAVVDDGHVELGLGREFDARGGQAPLAL